MLNSNWSSIDTILKTIQNAQYPVGSLYINMSVATNPATLLGFGTWTALTGIGIVGAGEGTDSNGNTQTFTAGTQVGEYIHTLVAAELPINAYQDIGHKHPPGSGTGFITNNGIAALSVVPPAAQSYDTPGLTGTGTANITNPTGGGAHNNVMPVIGAYMWERTA